VFHSNKAQIQSRVVALELSDDLICQARIFAFDQRESWLAFNARRVIKRAIQTVGDLTVVADAMFIAVEAISWIGVVVSESIVKLTSIHCTVSLIAVDQVQIVFLVVGKLIT
jgi:hypothetical protein